MEMVIACVFRLIQSMSQTNLGEEKCALEGIGCWVD